MLHMRAIDINLNENDDLISNKNYESLKPYFLSFPYDFDHKNYYQILSRSAKTDERHLTAV